MYVSIPKNYGGVAFQKDIKRTEAKSPPPIIPPKEHTEKRCEEENTLSACERCGLKEKNPLSCMMEAFRTRKKGGFDAEDILLVGLIVLLLGKEGNEDIILVLAMLLLL